MTIHLNRQSDSGESPDPTFESALRIGQRSMLFELSTSRISIVTVVKE